MRLAFTFGTQDVVLKCNYGLAYPLSFLPFLAFSGSQHTITWRVVAILRFERPKLVFVLKSAHIIDLQNLQ